MERINKLLIEKYNSLLNDMMIGYPIDQYKMFEIICLIHVMHFVGFDDSNSKERLEILAYYA